MKEIFFDLGAWTTLCVVVATFCTILVPTVYAFSSWRSTPLGRLFMLQSSAFAIAMLFTSLSRFWRPSSRDVVFATNAIVFTFIAISTLEMAKMIWRLNLAPRPSKRSSFMSEVNSAPKHAQAMLSNDAYDRLKKSVTLLLPGLGTLYFALAEIWGLPYGAQVVGSLAALNVFAGIVLSISSKSYDSSEAKYDGSIDVIVNPEGSKVLSLNLNEHPDVIPDMSQVLFKVNKS